MGNPGAFRGRDCPCAFSPDRRAHRAFSAALLGLGGAFVLRGAGAMTVIGFHFGGRLGRRFDRSAAERGGLVLVAVALKVLMVS